MERKDIPDATVDPKGWLDWVSRQPGVKVYINPDPKPLERSEYIQVREGITIHEILGRGEFSDDDES